MKAHIQVQLRAENGVVATLSYRGQDHLLLKNI